MSNSFESLKSKIDEFIKKYYFNKLLQGFLLSVGLLLAFFTVSAILEYFGQFSSNIRTIIFYSYLILALTVIVKFIVLPLLKWMKIGKVLNHEQASGIIGSFFPDVNDKLLNTIQLQNQAQLNQNELLLASIEQKTKNLSPIKFSSAINLSESLKKYGKYALVPFVFLAVLLIFQSNLITKPAQRILSYNKEFEKEAPFAFVVLNKNLTISKNSDFEIEVETNGKNLPDEVFLLIDKNQIKMEKISRNKFSYKLLNLNKSQTFQLTDGEFNSISYEIKVLPNPTLLNFKVNLIYPNYIQKNNETFANTGDFTIPQGTKIEWIFNTKDAENLLFMLNGKTIEMQQAFNSFKTQQTIKNASRYAIAPLNPKINKIDTLFYSIQVIEDRHPGIFVEQKQDSINPYLYYFYGKADDDYGINKLNFAYKDKGKINYIPVKIGKSTDEVFYYAIDFRTIVENGSLSESYFEVWDNDGVNGSKSTKSQTFSIETLSDKELKAEANQSSQSIKSSMKETMNEIMEIQKKSQELSKQIMENNSMDWQQQKKLKDFLTEQKKLQEKLEDLKNKNQLKNEKEKQLNLEDKELLEKQKEIEKMFKELLTPEMKELLKKMEELLKQQNKDELKKQMENLKLNNEEMKKQLDRTLEQFKQLELEKKINEQVSELNKLAEEQKELSKKTEEKSLGQEELKKQQDEINKKFEDIQKELKNIEEKNKELETPLKLDDTKKEEEDVKKDLSESSESLSKKQNKKAAQKQKDAADKMEEMAEKVKKSMEEAQEEQAEEDYYTLRQILENLIELSLQQEDLMQEFKNTKSYSPKFVELSQKQRKLKEDAKVIEDSLLALSKRQVHIKSFVNKELTNINYQMDKSINYLSKIETYSATASQQYVMTGLNNLSVMLSESLKKMQDEMKEKKDKKKNQGQCNNPGGKNPKSGKGGNKPKMGGMKQMQDALNKQLQEMKEGKEKGNNPNSQQFAKIAAQQEALRREIGRLEKLLKEEGKPGSLGDLEKTKQLMEQQEKDLVNKLITPETMKRMKEIETRMLEHEKAEREQDQDNKREAEQAKPIETPIPPAIKEYLEKKAKELELIRKVPNELTPYYKERVRVYFNKVGNN